MSVQIFTIFLALFFILLPLISCSLLSDKKNAAQPQVKISHQINETRLNDIHSKINETEHKKIIKPRTTKEIQKLIRSEEIKESGLSVSGGKHSMGGQQFGRKTIHLDMTQFNRILNFDQKKGIVEVQSGIEWPKLVHWLRKEQKGETKRWGIRQKQTGADSLSIGGALSSNVHGRGLKYKPIVQDVESFTLIDASGNIKNCSRTKNPELFRLAIGGYGLFGIIAEVRLQLEPVQKLERVVKIIDAKDFIPQINKSIKQGILYGDFQFSNNENSNDFLKRGVFSTYRPIQSKDKMPKEQKKLNKENWERLYQLAHTDKAKTYKEYSEFYLATNGQLYWSDTFQLSVYLDDYHETVDQKLAVKVPGSEMISEVYVPRDKLVKFLDVLRKDFRKHKVNVIYGTVRLIEQDDETFLPWAKSPWVCIVFNFHIDHDPKGLKKAEQDFQRLIDRALENDGSYFLTYHRWARKDQVLRAYPQFAEFLNLKKKYDPNEIFQSDWYRHYKKMFL